MGEGIRMRCNFLWHNRPDPHLSFSAPPANWIQHCFPSFLVLEEL